MEPIKTVARVVQKKALTKTVYEVILALPQSITFEPGQYVQLWVEPGLWRIYSLVEAKNEIITLLVDLRPGGDASKIWPGITVGAELAALLPMGGFRLEPNDRPKIFVTTGTGIAPCLPMLRVLAQEQRDVPVHLLFGAATEDHDFVKPYLDAWAISQSPSFYYRPCFSRRQQPQYGHSGRVNQVLWTLELALPEHDIYICGAPQMVAETIAQLKEKGLNNYFFEQY